MLSLLRQLLACVALMCALTGVAAEVAVPALSARVTDLSGTLNSAQQAALEAKLSQFETSHGSQVAILLVPSTQPEAIEQYSIRVVEQWRLGRKKQDDGVLILLAMQERKVRIEVGYGLEGVIPDAIAKRIIAETMTPYFKQGDYAGGLNAGVDQILALIDGEHLPAPTAETRDSTDGWENALPLILIAGLLVGTILRHIFGSFLGGAINGGIIGFAVWALGGSLLIAIVLAFLAFIFTLLGITQSLMQIGGLGGRGGGGGGFSGGGGGFGGGGASGGW